MCCNVMCIAGSSSSGYAGMRSTECSKKSLSPDGGVAKWLCSGLQSRVRRFDPDPRLQFFLNEIRQLEVYVASKY